MPKRLHPEKAAQVLALLRRGEPRVTIMKATGVSKNAVYRIADLNGLSVNLMRIGRPRKPRRAAPRATPSRATPIPPGQRNYRAEAASLRWSLGY